MKGRQRRSELIAAGVALLAESGWSGLTHRAVAARARANAGLVHYYFKGTPGLRLAVAREASRITISALFDAVLAAEDDAALARHVGRVLDAARQDPHRRRLTAELVTAAFDDRRISALVRRAFADGRARLARWLRARHRSWPPGRARGAAAVLVATVDGLALHLRLDPALRTREIQRVLRNLVSRMCADSTDDDNQRSAS